MSLYEFGEIPDSELTDAVAEEGQSSPATTPESFIPASVISLDASPSAALMLVAHCKALEAHGL